LQREIFPEIENVCATKLISGFTRCIVDQVFSIFEKKSFGNLPSFRSPASLSSVRVCTIQDRVPCNARKGHETRALLFCWRRPGLRAWTPGRLGPVVVPHACDASSLPPAVPGPWSSGLEGWETCEAISGNQAVGALRSLVLRPDSLEPVF